ncbi:DNA mismatch repair protein MutS [bacterium]|jgi:DNA mismatch repair protein MutS|nr:DNA mismatch repair protein MutS [bacterium]
MIETPMLRQYLAIKKNYQDAILFFRLGDFYEMFLDDAKLASRELSLTLTGRGKDENRIPMCGIPHHSSSSYITKLVNKGYKVAICEQVEAADSKKGITKRDVVRVITPGTASESTNIEETEHNFIVSISYSLLNNKYGICFGDASTGETFAYEVSQKIDAINAIYRLGAKEILLDVNCELVLDDSVLINRFESVSFEKAEKKLCSHFNLQSLKSFGIEDLNSSFPAVWAYLDYLMDTQKNGVPQVKNIHPFSINFTMQMDKQTIKNLELTKALDRKSDEGTLFWVLNETKTSMGGRHLRHRLIHPFRDESSINKQLDAVESLVENYQSRESVREHLNAVYDLERLMTRIAGDSQNPRDLVALKESLIKCQEIRLSDVNGDLLKESKLFFDSLSDVTKPCSNIIQLIESSIKENPPVNLRDGFVIREGYNSELDDLSTSFSEIRTWISTLENVEREKTGLKIKLGFNRVFGYYFEVSNLYKDQVPDYYIRKQTLTNGERFITPELKEKETILLNGEEKQKTLELEIYKKVILEIKEFIPFIQLLSEHIAKIDCIQSLATVAQKFRYTRPEFVQAKENPVFEVKQGRHPVLDKKDDVQFIPNDLELNTDCSFYLITGPNMAGKSTYMRQMALIAVMAQIGSFVPAESVVMSPIDRLFTRIGTLDNLYSGQSTFMVEMLETATILNNATSNSFIVLDEIGRGTSTFDGMSIAGAVSQHIHDGIRARALFATHYHELNELSKSCRRLKNYSMKISEVDGQVIFNYELIDGPADKSYGIHVAEMAGLPNEVIQQAKLSLEKYEQESAQETASAQLALF